MTNSKMQFKSLADMPGWEAAFTSSRDRVTESSGAYSLVPLIFRCLRLRCDALVSAPVVVENKRGNAVDWPYLVSPKRLFWGVQASMLMRGAAFVQKRANQLGGTADLYLLNPYSTTVTYNAAGVNFVYSGTNSAGESVSQTFTQENIIYIREYNPTDDIYPGPSAVGVALNDAALLRYIGRFGAKFFEQGAMPLTLVSVDSMDDRETERVTNWFKNFGTTIANAWRSFGTRAKLDIKTITPPLNTLALPELTAQARANIALAFGIPQTMLEDAANYATAKEHRLSFYQETVAPAGDIIMEYFNEQLFKPRGMTAHFDFESLDIYQEDEANRASSLQALINAGLPLRLAMEILGYELTEEQEAELEESEAEPAPAPVIAPQAEQLPDEEPIQEELAKWQRKALKAYKAGKSPAVKFESDIIPDEMHAEIDAALATAQDEDAIKAAFRVSQPAKEADELATQLKRAMDYLEMESSQFKYSDDQPRDENGRFSSGGGGGSGGGDYNGFVSQMRDKYGGDAMWGNMTDAEWTQHDRLERERNQNRNDGTINQSDTTPRSGNDINEYLRNVNKGDGIVSNNEIIAISRYAKDKYSEEYENVGVRIQTDSFGANPGDTISHNSSVWDDGVELQDTINGVSAIDVRTAHYLPASDNNGYMGRTVLILGSRYSSRGEDQEEIIMRDATILEIIKLDD